MCAQRRGGDSDGQSGWRDGGAGGLRHREGDRGRGWRDGGGGGSGRCDRCEGGGWLHDDGGGPLVRGVAAGLGGGEASSVTLPL